ncbi:hypothetical protein [Streptomyces lydicus]|uniref:hypothetical protein n=1 Tax=Streptomyces lydicus TaxID=47763 RepID=UPI0037B233A9
MSHPALSHTVDFISCDVVEAHHLTRELVNWLCLSGTVRASHPARGSRSWVCSLAEGGSGQLVLTAPADPASVAAHTYRIVATVEQGTAAESQAFFQGVRHLPFTSAELKATEAELPLTDSLARRWPDKPLAGVGVLLTIHHMRDFLVLAQSLLSLGVDRAHLTVIDKESLHPHPPCRRASQAAARHCGVAVSGTARRYR